MKKQSERTTEHIIEEVIIRKKDVLLRISGEEYIISPDVYLSSYYYPGKAVDEKEIREIQEKEKSIKACSYCSSLLSRRRYTEKEIHDKLKTKFRLSEKEILSLLRPFQEAEIINDKEYALDYAQAKAEAGYGKNLIFVQLKQKGISEDILNSKEIREILVSSLENLFPIIEKYDHSKAEVPLRKRKEMVLSMLSRRGFSKENCHSAIEDFYSGNDEDKEKMRQVLKKEAQKCYNSLESRNMDARKKKESFIRKLLSKGFEYDDISSVIDEEGYQFL